VRLKIAIPESHVSKDVLDAGLEATTRLNEQMLKAGEIPTFERGLRYGIQWRPEPKGDEHFDSADKVISRKWGDCDDLAPWHAASLRVTGEDPAANAVVYQSGPARWHAVVQRGDGSIDDPSKRAGMRPGIAPGVFGTVNGDQGFDVVGISGAVVPPMFGPERNGVGAYIVRPKIAIRPFYGALQARADLPWQWREHLRDEPNRTDWNLTALHTAPVASTALTGAIQDVCCAGLAVGGIDEDHLDRLCAIADACEGADYYDLERIYGADHAEAASAVVGSLFGKLKRGLGKLAKKAVMPIARGAASFVPGGSIALKAAEQGARMFRGGGGGKRRPAAAPAPFARPAPFAAPGATPGARAVHHVPSSGGGRGVVINVY
jgi:hypothetical protein